MGHHSRGEDLPARKPRGGRGPAREAGREADARASGRRAGPRLPRAPRTARRGDGGHERGADPVPDALGTRCAASLPDGRTDSRCAASLPDGRRDEPPPLEPPPKDLSERRREEADMSESRREEWVDEGPSVRSEPDGRRAGRPLVRRGRGHGGAREAQAIGRWQRTWNIGTQRSAGSEGVLTGQRAELVAALVVQRKRIAERRAQDVGELRRREWREVRGAWWWQQWQWQPVTC